MQHTLEETMTLALYRAARAALDAQVAGDADPMLLIERARRRWTALTRLVGSLRSAESRSEHALRRLVGTREWRLLRALEHDDGTPSPLLCRRCLRQEEPDTGVVRTVVSPSADPTMLQVPLGASWVPAKVVSAFSKWIAGAKGGWGIDVRQVPGHGWRVDVSSSRVQNSVENTLRWGCEHRDAADILSDLLNLKIPVGKKFDFNGARVPDAEATAEVRGKAEEIRDEWARWLRAEPARWGALVAEYDKRFCGIEHQVHTGEISLPGLALEVNSAPFYVREHQRVAVERIAADRGPDNSCLVVHTVGFGKSLSGIVGAVRRWRAGKVDRCFFVVPKMVLRQWRQMTIDYFPGYAEEFNVAPEEMNAKESTKFWGSVARGESVFNVVTYEQFASCLPSVAAVAAEAHDEVLWLEETIAGLLFSQKAEKKILHRALSLAKEALAELLNKHARRVEKSKGAPLWDDVLGDPARAMLVFDEWQYLKKAKVRTKMTRVTGLPGGESRRAADGMAKAHQVLAAGGKVVGLTGTPITNSLAEVYVAMKFFQPRRLKAIGLWRFDDWASTFTEPMSSVEMGATGEFRPITRLRFVNLPDLVGLLSECWSFASQSLEVKRPDLVGGQPTVVEVEGSDDLIDYVEELAERADAIRSGEVDPSDDNLLKITSDGRKAAMWNGEPGQTFPRDKLTKLDACADRVWQVYREHHDDRGVQLVFCDLGTPKGDADADATPEERFAPEGLYGELLSRLLDRGMLRHQVAWVHACRDEAARIELFRKVNAGEVRVLLGSTDKLGVGTNPQRRIVGLHHLDCPWRPDNLVQRTGRGRRDGNLWSAMYEFIYVTTRSYDVCLWQLIQAKAEFISKLQEGQVTARTVEDVGDLVITSAMAKALALGDSRVLDKVRLETQLVQLERQHRAWKLAQITAVRDLETIPAKVAELRQSLEATRSIMDLRTREAEFVVHLRDAGSSMPRPIVDRAVADSTVYVLSNMLRTTIRSKPVGIGLYRGHPLRLEIKYGAVALVMDAGGIPMQVLNVHATGSFAALDRELGMLEVRAKSIEKTIESEEARLSALQTEATSTWPTAPKAAVLLVQYDALCQDLAKAGLVDRRSFSL